MLPQGLPGHLVLRCSTVEMQCAQQKPLTCSLTRHCARDHYVDLSVCPLPTLKCQRFLLCMTGNYQSDCFWWGKVCVCVCVCVWDRGKKEKEIDKLKLEEVKLHGNFREEEVWAAVSEEVKCEWKDLTLSWCLLIKSGLLDYILCCIYGNLSKLISPFSAGEWNIMQETVMRPHTY